VDNSGGSPIKRAIMRLTSRSTENQDTRQRLRKFLPYFLIFSMFVPVSNLLTYPLFASESNRVSTGFTSDQELFASPIRLRNLSHGLPFAIQSATYGNLTKESTRQAIKKIGNIVIFLNKKTYHCGFTESQNTLHKVAKKFMPEEFKSYGLLDFRYLQCGFCHQRNYLLTEILNSYGLTSNLVSLNEHVVGRVMINNEDYFIDSDYGVGPFPVSKRFDISFITREYRKAGAREYQISAILRAFATTQDDQDYDLNKLRSIQESQEKILNNLNFILTFIVLLVVSCLFRLRNIRLRNRRKFTLQRLMNNRVKGTKVEWAQTGSNRRPTD